MSYYIVPWAGMWQVYRGNEGAPAASVAGRERAEHWCRSDAAAQSVIAEIYHGAWGSRRIPA